MDKILNDKNIDVVDITEIEPNPQSMESILGNIPEEKKEEKKAPLKEKQKTSKQVKCPYCFKYIDAPEQIKNQGNGAKTKYVCPKCGGELPEKYGKYPVKILSLVGATSSGKTVYLSNLLKFAKDYVRNPLSNYSYSVIPGNSVIGGDQNENFLEKVTDVCKLELKDDKWFEDKIKHEENRRVGAIIHEEIKKGDHVVINFPGATNPDDTIRPLIIELSYEFANDFSVCRHLVLYDIAGERFREVKDILECDNLKHSDGFIFIISPDDVKGLLGNNLKFREIEIKNENGEVVGTTSVYEEKQSGFYTNRTSMIDVLTTLKTAFGMDEGKSLKKLPLAIALTKSDMYYGATLDRGNGEFVEMFKENSALFKNEEYEENNNNYKKSGNTKLSEEISALFPYNSTIPEFKSFRTITHSFNTCKMFAFSSFPAIRKIEFKGRENVVVREIDGANGNETEKVKPREIYEVKAESLVDKDFRPIRVEEPIGWLFYKWGWIGADKEAKFKDSFATKLLKLKIVFNEGKNISNSEKLLLCLKILAGKEKSTRANME